MIPQARHGWVLPLPDGFRKACGGPADCVECGYELNLLQLAASRLRHWREHHNDTFYDLLFELISKADRAEREALRPSFPWEMLIWDKWYDSPNAEIFEARLEALNDHKGQKAPSIPK